MRFYVRIFHFAIKIGQIQVELHVLIMYFVFLRRFRFIEIFHCKSNLGQR